MEFVIYYSRAKFLQAIFDQAKLLLKEFRIRNSYPNNLNQNEQRQPFHRCVHFRLRHAQTFQLAYTI